MNGFSSQALTDATAAWAVVLGFLPKLLLFAIVLVAGYVLAKFLAKVFDTLLERLHFDDMVERGGAKRVLAKSGLDASSLLSKLLFYGLFLLVLQFAFGIFGPNPVSNLLTQLIAYIPNLIVAAIIVIVAMAIANAVKEVMARSLGGLSYGSILARVASGAIILIGAFAALDQLGIAPAIVQGMFYALLATIAGSAIVAIGGGGIQPMRRYWERAFSRIERTPPTQDRAVTEGAKPLEHETAGSQHRREAMTIPYGGAAPHTGPELHPHQQ